MMIIAKGMAGCLKILYRFAQTSQISTVQRNKQIIDLIAVTVVMDVLCAADDVITLRYLLQIDIDLIQLWKVLF